MDSDAELVETLARALFPEDGAQLLAVYRFGSTSRGEARPDSDVDLAFLAASSPEPERTFFAAQDLAIALHRDVDLVDLRRASTVMRAQIVTRGERVHTGDANAAAYFEMYALSDYARLQEERAACIAAFEEPYLG